MVIGMLAASFAGGAVAQWLSSGPSEALGVDPALLRKREAERNRRLWTNANPIFTRKLIVAESKTKTLGTIDNSGLKLYDSSGKTRVKLDSGAGNLVLLDSSGRERAKLGTGFALQDSSGRTRVMLDHRGLTLYGASGKKMGVFGLQSNGSVGVSVMGKGGKLRQLDVEIDELSKASSGDK